MVLVREDEEARVEVRIEGDVAPRDRLVPGSLPSRVRLGKRLSLPIPHGANIGYLDGVGAWYEGLLDSPQGPKEPVTVASLVSANRGVTVRAIAVIFAPASRTLTRQQADLRQDIDTILNTVAWSPPREGPIGSGDTSARRADPRAGTPPGGLRPRDVAKAYDIEPLWDLGIRGRGETIALLSLDTFRQTDVAKYEELMNISRAPRIERIPVLGGVLLGQDTIEVNLDIDVIRAVAPEAKILNYEAQRSWDGFVAALRKINDDGRASIVSVSWGLCLTEVDREVRDAMESELERAREAGTTVFVASGDAGAFSCLHQYDDFDADRHGETVDWPAASPSVVAVGGTRLSLRRDRSYFSEDGWEDTLSSGGTGGGVSPIHRRPPWQPLEVVRNSSSNGYRQVPDVAGPADCDSAFFIVYPSFEDGTWKRRQGPFGCGTSAAAPFWAATAALVDQYARSKGQARVGFLGQILYELALKGLQESPFHDVQTGGNLKHNAGPGWDYATGLGSPDVWNLARAVVAHLGLQS